MADTDPHLAAALEARAAFALDDHELELITIGENVTYRATPPGGDHSFVLRLHRPGYHSLAELDSERVWLAALEDAEVSVPVPAATPQRVLGYIYHRGRSLSNAPLCKDIS